MKCDGCWHFLLDEVQTVLCRFVTSARDVYEEIILIEEIEIDIDMTLAHDFVDFTILLSTHKLFVFVRQLNFDLEMRLSFLHEREGVDDVKCCLHRVIGTIDVESEILKIDLCTRADTDICKHAADIVLSRLSLSRVIQSQPPGCGIELARLNTLAIEDCTYETT